MSGVTQLPEHVRRAIYGETTEDEKRQACNKSLSNWWQEYAARKNHEDEEHVADTLLYDERCHLPRSAPRPDVVSDVAVTQDVPQAAMAPAASAPAAPAPATSA